MSDNNMLSQEEIDALLKGTGPADGDDSENLTDQEIEDVGKETAERQEELQDITEGQDINPEQENLSDSLLSQQEVDALGEVGNITMGSGATALSELLNQRVVITSPKVKVISREEFFDSFKIPNVIIQVDFKEGLTGYNILVIKMRDAIVMADLMMGGSGEAQGEEIGEIELSAASEAMNQMIGSASTSLSSMFGMPINISPPITNVWHKGEEHNISLTEEVVVVVSFDMKIGDLLDTEIMQVLSVETAKNQVKLMMESLIPSTKEEVPVSDTEVLPDPDVVVPSQDLSPADELASTVVSSSAPNVEEDDWLNSDFWSEQEKEQAQPVKENQLSAPRQRIKPQRFEAASLDMSNEEKNKLELLLDVPLKVSVILGRTKRPIKEVLSLTPGSIVELNSLVDEPVEILVNGTLVAKGEVVVVNENFGVRITYILSPQERLQQLK